MRKLENNTKVSSSSRFAGHIVLLNTLSASLSRSRFPFSLFLPLFFTPLVLAHRESPFPECHLVLALAYRWLRRLIWYAVLIYSWNSYLTYFPLGAAATAWRRRHIDEEKSMRTGFVIHTGRFKATSCLGNVIFLSEFWDDLRPLTKCYSKFSFGIIKINSLPFMGWIDIGRGRRNSSSNADASVERSMRLDDRNM